MDKIEFKRICRYAVQYHFCYCYLCGLPILNLKDLSIDHVKPRCRKGGDSPDNLMPTHKHCNSAKGDLSLKQFRMIQELSKQLKK